MSSSFQKIDTRGIKDLNKKIAHIAKNFKQAFKKPAEINAVLFSAGNEMRNFIITEMRNTARAPWSYKKTNTGKRHYPSLPGHFPAIDTGEGIRSVAFDNKIGTKNISLEIGVTSGAPYLRDLELLKRTKNRRPWLEPTVKKFEKKITDDLEKLIPDNVSLYIETALKDKAMQ